MSLSTLVQAFRDTKKSVAKSLQNSAFAEYLRRTKWLPAEEIPDYSEDFYKYLIIDDLKPDELIRGASLDAQLRSVTVEFKSRNRIKYQAVHYLQNYEHGPHIHLYSHTNLRVSDWNEVGQVIDGIVNGSGHKSQPNGNEEAKLSPVRRIQMLERPTAAGIARYLEVYKEYFIEVKAIALFEHVPKSFFKYNFFLNLPPNRIRLVEYSHAT